MIKLRFTLIGVLLLVVFFAHSQDGTPVQNLDPYKKAYKVKDHWDGWLWDMHTDSYNLYGGGVDHGDYNQRWIVFPEDPGSDYVYLVNMHDGRILEKESDDNLFLNSDITMANSQRFKMVTVDSNRYKFQCSDENKVIDLNTGSKNLYCGAPHNGDNQSFNLIETSSLENADRYEFNIDTVEALLHAGPQSLQDGGYNGPLNLKVIGQTLVPFFMVSDPYYPGGNSQRVRETPYYIFQLVEYYKMVEAFTIGNGVIFPLSYKTEIGLKHSTNISMKDLIGITMSQSEEVGSASGKAQINRAIKRNLQTKWDFRISTTDFSETTETDIEKYTFEKEIDETKRFFIFKKIRELRVLRGNENYAIHSFNYSLSKSVDILTYPPSQFESVNVTEEDGVVIYKLVSRDPYNSIESENIAKVTATTVADDYYVENLFDDEDNAEPTFWRSEEFANTSVQEINLDLKEPVLVRGFGVSPDYSDLGTSPSGLEVMLFKDKEWQSIGIYTDLTPKFWEQNTKNGIVYFNTQKTGYSDKIKVVLNNGCSESFVAISNLEFYDYKMNFNEKETKFNVTNEGEEMTFELYPNPSDGYFTIKFDESMLNSTANSANMNIYSISGNLVYSKNLNLTSSEENLNLDLDDGVYIVEIVCGDYVENRKLIVR